MRPKADEIGAGFMDGVIACGPTILGYWSIGFAAGAIGSLSGFSLSEVIMLAGLLYAGSAQFMFYALYPTGAGLIAVVLAVLLINMRYFLMSSYMAIYFKGGRLREKFIGGALLTDETFGVASQYAHRKGFLPFSWLLGLNLAAYVNWIGANLVGFILAASIPISLAKGLEFSLTAMFIGLLILNYFSSHFRLIELITITCSALIIVFTMKYVNINILIIVAVSVSAVISTIILNLRRIYSGEKHV